MNITVPMRAADIKNPNAEVAKAHKEGMTNDLKTRNQSFTPPKVGKLGLKGNGRDL